jgi:rSAM/selenodomain-associated transferase 1
MITSRRARPALPVAVAVMAKEPAPGRVKTRLCPPYTMTQAATLAGAALADTLDALCASAVADRVLVIDGDPSGWLRPGIRAVAQRGNGLAERLDNAMADVASATGRPVLLVGMDTPQLHANDLETAASILLGSDAVLGPASDGGFWAIGVLKIRARLCSGVPMSSPDTGRRQLERLRALGLHPALLEVRTDVDDAESAREVAALAPRTRFARLLADIGDAA